MCCHDNRRQHHEPVKDVTSQSLTPYKSIEFQPSANLLWPPAVTSTGWGVVPPPDRWVRQFGSAVLQTTALIRSGAGMVGASWPMRVDVMLRDNSLSVALLHDTVTGTYRVRHLIRLGSSCTTSSTSPPNNSPAIQVRHGRHGHFAVELGNLFCAQSLSTH